MPAHHLHNVGVCHGAAHIPVCHFGQDHFGGALAVFPELNLRMLSGQFVQCVHIAGTGGDRDIDSLNVFRFAGQGAIVTVADQLLGDLGVGRPRREQIVAAVQVGKAGGRQVSSTGFQGGEHIGGGVQHGPFHLPATGLGVVGNQGVFGADRVLVPVQVVGGRAVSGGNLQDTGFRGRLEPGALGGRFLRLTAPAQHH